MKKIFCIGDSLTLPGHLNKYEDTWFYKLKKELPKHDYISFFKRQLTTNALVEMGGGAGGIDNMPHGADCLEFFEPDIVIVQLGIVDSAPRLFTKFDNIVVKVLPKKLLNSYIKILKKVRSRKKNNTLVSFEKFKSNLNNYISRAKNLKTKIIFISISIPDERIVKKNKFIAENAMQYNQYYKKLAGDNDFVITTDPLTNGDFNEDIYEDGYHLNKEGHEKLFQKLKVIFNELT